MLVTRDLCITQYLASKNISRSAWSTFELVCPGLSMQYIGLGVSSLPGTSPKTYTVAEVTRWWREVILSLIKKAIVARGGGVDVYSEYMSEFKASLGAELVPDPPPDLCHAFNITQYAAAQSMRRWTLGTFKLVCRGVPLHVGLGVGSQTGDISGAYTMTEVIEWWRGEVLDLLNAAIQARGRARMGRTTMFIESRWRPDG